MASAAKTLARAPINVRIAEEEKARIDYAAHISGDTRSSFMLSASLAKADEVILNRVHYVWSAETLEAFEAVIAAPPKPTAQAVDMMRKTKPWTTT